LHLFSEPDVEKLCRIVFNLLKEGGIFFGRHIVHNDKPCRVKILYVHAVDFLRETLEKIGFKEVDAGEKSFEYTIEFDNAVRFTNFYCVKPNQK